MSTSLVISPIRPLEGGARREGERLLALMKPAARPLGSRELASQARGQAVLQARRIMHARLADPELSIEQVAAELHLSARQLQRSFRDQGSSGYRAELTRLRMLEAARLLESSEKLKIAEVARRVGYRQPMHFAKAFRRWAGSSPAQWRRQRLAQREADLLAA